MRIYNARLGKFLSVDPLTASYSMLTPYQFASNRPIDGSDLDGLEWVLRIYSPSISASFLAAVDAQDIYEQRRLTYWALNHTFQDNYVKDHFVGDIFPANNAVATLTYDINSPAGVSVYTASYKTDYHIAFGVWPRHWAPDPVDPAYPDAKYPVDVKSDEYYGENDFVGKYFSSTGIGGLGSSRTRIQGYMRGYGYVQYYSNGWGFGLSAGVATGPIWGSYRFNKFDRNYGPYSLTGYGLQFGVGYDVLEGGKWYGFSSHTMMDEPQIGDAAWSGGYGGLSISVGAKLGGSGQQTYTTIVQPDPLQIKAGGRRFGSPRLW